MVLSDGVLADGGQIGEVLELDKPPPAGVLLAVVTGGVAGTGGSRWLRISVCSQVGCFDWRPEGS